MATVVSLRTTALSPQVGAQLILVSVANTLRPIPAGLIGGVIGAPKLNAAPSGSSTSAYASG